jgi:hypothetical protein
MVSDELLNAKPMTMELGILLTLNFATLYVGKTKSLHFHQIKDCLHNEL